MVLSAVAARKARAERRAAEAGVSSVAEGVNDLATGSSTTPPTAVSNGQKSGDRINEAEKASNGRPRKKARLSDSANASARAEGADKQLRQDVDDDAEFAEAAEAVLADVGLGGPITRPRYFAASAVAAVTAENGSSDDDDAEETGSDQSDEQSSGDSDNEDARTASASEVEMEVKSRSDSQKGKARQIDPRGQTAQPAVEDELRVLTTWRPVFGGAKKNCVPASTSDPSAVLGMLADEVSQRTRCGDFPSQISL